MNSTEQFEQAFPVPSNIRWSEEHQSYGFIRRKGNDLRQVHRYRSMWNAWQASREALVVKKPSEPAPGPDGYFTQIQSAFIQGQMSFKWAVEEAGIKVVA